MSAVLPHGLCQPRSSDLPRLGSLRTLEIFKRAAPWSYIFQFVFQFVRSLSAEEAFA